MQDCHYGYIENKNGSKAEMMLDDALMCKIETEKVCEEFYKDKQLFDFSDYLKDSRHYDHSHNLVVKPDMKHVAYL